MLLSFINQCPFFTLIFDLWAIFDKRQFGARPFGMPQFGSSSSLANANAFSQGFGPNGFGASAANAQAQGFRTQGPLGGFGANAANSATQSFQAGPGGLQVILKLRWS